MGMHRRRAILRACAALAVTIAVGGCGDDGSVDDATDDAPKPRAAQTSGDDVPAAAPADPPAVDAEAAAVRAATRPAGEDGLRVAANAARIVTKRSEFGTVLFDANGQVVYAFENDTRNRSNCVSDECVKAWPPVLTKQAPTGGRGVRSSLLGTTTRADGSRQVTYAGRPLYFYEHEAPGEIKCHDIDLHGGLWWVVAPDGVPVGT